ncbi:MAG: hypothetical protein EKK57_10825 [Proteobacteria bacterium]|nr:MAG: hypothetical protein EKK57_10825 [Pseudomonadota bacterium]
MKYKNKYLITTGPTEDAAAQLPNVFTYAGVKTVDGVTYIGLVQEGQASEEPTWFAATNIESDFEVIE